MTICIPTPHRSARLSLAALITVTLAGVTSPAAGADDNHWSRQFAKPRNSQSMAPNTGMSAGANSPSVSKVKWHDGKLWMAGAWEAGVAGDDITRRQQNDYWYLWSWSPTAGYEVVCHYHSAQGGRGPDGRINDFRFLPDGRLVVAGEFTRLDNPGGNRYHRVGSVAIYDPNEPTANKWRPLGTRQYNGTVSGSGSVVALAFDERENMLYIGGNLTGIRDGRSNHLHRFNFETNSYETMSPAVGGSRPYIYTLVVDDSTTRRHHRRRTTRTVSRPRVPNRGERRLRRAKGRQRVL